MEMTQSLQKDIAPSALTIAEFCWRQKISVPSYYQLKKRGLGPIEMRFGNVVRITPEAEAAWRKARENPGTDEAADISATGEALRARAQRASRAAIASPRHISARRRGVSGA